MRYQSRPGARLSGRRSQRNCSLRDRAEAMPVRADRKVQRAASGCPLYPPEVAGSSFAGAIGLDRDPSLAFLNSRSAGSRADVAGRERPIEARLRTLQSTAGNAAVGQMLQRQASGDTGTAGSEAAPATSHSDAQVRSTRRRGPRAADDPEPGERVETGPRRSMASSDARPRPRCASIQRDASAARDRWRRRSRDLGGARQARVGRRRQGEADDGGMADDR